MAEQEPTRARTHLSDLVRDRRAELRLSLRGLEAQCVDPDTGEGGLVKYSWIDRLEKRQPVIPPQLPELRALAVGLQLPLSRLQDAAGAQFFGIDSLRDQSGEVKAMVAHAETLSPEDQAKVAAIVEAYARKSRSPDGA
ncbi:XRE family transcriptional regulator [Streptomyces samsunensis]|uniref:XRE family transcriptional regulator n=1 Tax=Streptomyces malaysiensis TaxID=92644 RepID=UPI001582FA12|nr:XRE family transcriptional regulator [Streptomyces samsunensis]NUH35323.1 XRE family transcriptional regulator [Streptomyces samsunensis]